LLDAANTRVQGEVDVSASPFVFEKKVLWKTKSKGCSTFDLIWRMELPYPENRATYSIGKTRCSAVLDPQGRRSAKPPDFAPRGIRRVSFASTGRTGLAF
jgi:hypothetical protein